MIRMNSSVIYTDNFCLPKSELVKSGISLPPNVFQSKVEKFILHDKAKEIYELYKNPRLLEKRYNEMTDVPRFHDGYGKSMLIEFLQKNAYKRENLDRINLDGKTVRYFSKIFLYYIREKIFEYSIYPIPKFN